MLIKYSQTDKKAKLSSACKQQRNTVMKGIAGGAPKAYRRAVKGISSCSSVVSKRAAAPQKRIPSMASGGVIASRRISEDVRGAVGGIVGALDTCDNSNDSGLGFEHSSESHKATPAAVVHPAIPSSHLLHFDSQEESWDNHCSEVKRQRLGIKVERSDEGSSEENFSVFSVACRDGSQVSSQGQQTRAAVLPASIIRPVAQNKMVPVPGKSVKRKALQGNSGHGSHSALSSSILLPPRGPDGNYPLTAQLPSSTLVKNDGAAPSLAQLLILAQPESQHRARYQTEGSRGAVKDRSGNGFPIVKLVGFNGTAKLQVFIGTDLGRVAPHMFYQACRVSGKNSTPCSELKVDGTVLIEVDFDSSKDMVITCDCVGILKERNVDVEHRFPEQSPGRSKKKSTRCRMVFRANLQLPNGSTETLQAISQPIVCTQPPGIPEICKKSLTGCGCGGGAELFILGKNFLKDTRVVFCLGDDGTSSCEDDDAAEYGEATWQEQVVPDREFLQPTHLVCVVPPFCRRDISAPVQVKLLVKSSGKKSEAHIFTYTPEGAPSLVSPSGTSPSSPATTTSLSPPACIASAVCSPLPLPANPSGKSETKMAVRLIAPALALSTPAVATEVQQGIPLSLDVNPLLTKVEPSDMPVSPSPRVPESPVSGSGVSQLPNLGGPFISCHPITSSQGVTAKEGVHPVVLWSTDVNGMKVLSAPLQLPSSSSVQLSISNSLTEQQVCPTPKEVSTCLTPSSDIPKPQTNLMVSSNSEANLIQQFVSDNISSPLPAQSGQSVEKFLSRIEQKLSLPNASIKVEDNQPHVSEGLPLPSDAPSLPSNIVMQFASMLQNQKIVDQQVASNATENRTSVSGHSLVLDSLTHSMPDAVASSVEADSTTSPVISNQAESSNLLSTSPSSIAFVKPIQDQSLPTVPVRSEGCGHNMRATLPLTSAKLSSKEQLNMCRILQDMSDSAISPEVRSDEIPQTMGHSCMVNMQSTPLSLAVSMQAPCSLTSDPITAALTDRSLATASKQSLPQTLPQVSLEHDGLIPIVTSETILHSIDASSTQKDQIEKLNCDSISSNDTISLNMPNSVASAGLVQHLEHTMRTSLQMGEGLVNNLENGTIETQNLSIGTAVVPMERSDACQDLLQPAEKDACRSAVQLANIHPVVFPPVRLPMHPLARKDIEDQHRSQSRVAMQCALKEGIERLITSDDGAASSLATPQPSTQLHLAVTVGPRKGEDGGMVPQELTQMSDHDLLSYINPSCFDQV